MLLGHQSSTMAGKNQYYNNNSKNLSNNFGLNGMHAKPNQILMYSQQLQQQQQQQQHDLNGVALHTN